MERHVSELTGKQLNDYRVLRRLGRGAMAEVYLAEQISLRRQVALKVLSAELAHDPTYVARFHQEAQAAAGLVHGGIVQIHEVGEADGIHYIAQEYVAGKNLGELIHREGRIAPGQTLDILRQVAAALHKAAEQGIVHRDIKPENIMLARSGEVKVADFGLARVADDRGRNHLTQAGITMGTPLYMSPEQVEGKPLDSRSDIYSLGVTAYHMLCGEAPFGGETPMAVAVQHLNVDAVPLTAHVADIPSELAAVVHRMLGKKADDRFASPADLLAELRRVASLAAEQGWGTDRTDWASVDLSTSSPALVDITSQLDRVMKTSAMLTPIRSKWWPMVAAMAGCLLLGVLFGLKSRPSNLLAGVNAGPPEQESVEAQIYHAAMVDTEAGWQVVGEYFPNADTYYHNLARQGLVRHYFFSRKSFAAAIPTLKQLEGETEAGTSQHTFAVAGLAVAYQYAGKTGTAGKWVQQLNTTARSQLAETAPRMSALLDEA